MRVSSRRLLWGLNVMLLLAAAVIFRPVRSWIDQTIIARAIHPNFNVQEIHLHPNKMEDGLSVVEATQFEWSSSHGDRNFGIAAQRAWVVVENESLVDKVVTIPKALLQHSKMFLESIPQTTAIAAKSNLSDPADGRSLWQRQLNSRFGELEWNDLKQHFDQVLKLDAFSDQCGSKIDSWVSNTGKLASDAQSLASDNDVLGNPLRDNLELTARLAKLEQLIAQESTLRSEIVKVDATVQAKLEEIGTQFDAHVGLIKERAVQHKNDNKSQIVGQLLEQTGGRIISQFKSFAEVADLLCRAIQRNDFSANEDYRTPGRDLLNLSNLMASGVFAVDDAKSPFRLQSQCVLTAKEPFGTVARANFRYQFDSNPFTVKIAASSRIEQPEIVDLQIEIVPLEKPAVDITAQTQPDIAIGSAQWVVGSNGHSIAGELCIDRNLLPFLTEDNSALTTALGKHLSDAEKVGQTLPRIFLEIGGTWASPTWKTDGMQIPQWLESTIDAQLEQQLRDNQQQMVARLEKYVATEIDKLGNTLSQRIDIAQKQADRYTHSLSLAHSTLKSKLATESNTEFARSSQEEVKR